METSRKDIQADSDAEPQPGSHTQAAGPSASGSSSSGSSGAAGPSAGGSSSGAAHPNALPPPPPPPPPPPNSTAIATTGRPGHPSGEEWERLIADWRSLLLPPTDSTGKKDGGS
eukprot:2673345-Pyramimonas_sp.AAC.1